MRLRTAIIIGIFMGHGLGLLFAPLPTLAASGGVLISELQTGGAATGHANDEFIELYNSTASDISMAGWQLEYRSFSSANGNDCTKGWTKTQSLGPATIKSHGFYLLADKNYALVSDARFSFDLSGTAGTIHVLDSAKQVVDALAWGDGSACGFGRAAALSAGQSLERMPGAQAPTGGNGYNTGDNFGDFLVRPIPEPQMSTTPTETPLQFADFSGGDSTTQLQLSEMLVNPDPTSTPGAFLELYNAGTKAVVTNQYVIKLGLVSYFLPQRVMLPGTYTVIAPDVLPLTFSPTNGSVSLQDSFGNVLETVQWPDAPIGASLIPAGNTWVWTSKATPGAVNIQADLPSVAPAGLGSGTPVTYPEVDLNELLPDPAAPLTDANDEFIELYNPNLAQVNLAGYMLKAGPSLSSSFIIPAGTTIAGAGYLALKSSETHLALSNTGSSVAIFAPDGTQIGLTVSYQSPKTGSAWAKFDATWNWTDEPTPGAANVQTTDVAAPVVAKTTKVSTAPKLSTAKPGKVKAVTSTKAPKAKAAAKKTKSSAPLVAAATSPAGKWLLFVMAGVTIAYVIYEFRYDLRNFYFKRRGHPGSGRAAGEIAPGRGSDPTGERPWGRQNDLRPGTSPRPRVQW